MGDEIAQLRRAPERIERLLVEPVEPGEIDAGRISLDGIDIRDLSRHELRSQVGMVLQDAWLFSGTIRENIRYGRQDATD